MWLEHYRTFWDDRLTALETYLLAEGRPDRNGAPEQPWEKDR